MIVRKFAHAVAGVPAALLLMVPAAHADRITLDEGGDTGRCVTYPEYSVVLHTFTHQGISRDQVRRIFDTDGHRTSTAVMDAMAGQVALPHGYEVVVPVHRMVRKYPVCVDDLDPTGGYAYVEFNMRNDRMVSGLMG